MGLSARERLALRAIAGGLAESDPDLVAKLAKLSRLMANEDKPTAEQSQAARRHIVGSLFRWLAGARRRGHARWHSARASALMAVWLATACALIATAAVLSHVTASGRCSPLAVACGSHAPAGHAQHSTGLAG